MRQDLIIVAISCSLLSPGAAIQAELCAIDPVPAATLLFPYVAADVSAEACASGTGQNTRMTVINAGPKPTLAHVTLWTDWGVPALGFQVYLTGYDAETLDLQDWLCHGDLPATGPLTSPHGELSEPSLDFPNCGPGGPLGGEPIPSPLKFYGPERIGEDFRGHLKAWLTGGQSPLAATCAGSGAGGDGLAVGYVSVDMAVACDLRFPSDPGYFTGGVAGFRNVLLGDFARIYDDGQEVHMLAIHVEAASAGTFEAGDLTFYGRYVQATAIDRREPLPTDFATHVFQNYSNLTSAFLIWREVPATTPLTCGVTPAWWPLAASAELFDAEENPTSIATSAPNATQELSSDALIGPISADAWFALDLDHDEISVYSTDRAQGWVLPQVTVNTTLHSAWHPVATDGVCSVSSP